MAEVEAAGERDELGVARPHGDDEGPQQDDSKGGGDEPGADVPDFPCPEHAAGGQRADALLDSGATHPLRARQEGEDIENLDEIDVALAGGEMKVIRITEGGIIVQENDHHSVGSAGGEVALRGDVGVVHPELGALRIHMEDGCPYVTQRTATKLLGERALEVKNKESALCSRGGWTVVASCSSVCGGEG